MKTSRLEEPPPAALRAAGRGGSRPFLRPSLPGGTPATVRFPGRRGKHPMIPRSSISDISTEKLEGVASPKITSSTVRLHGRRRQHWYNHLPIPTYTRIVLKVTLYSMHTPTNASAHQPGRTRIGGPVESICILRGRDFHLGTSRRRIPIRRLYVDRLTKRTAPACLCAYTHGQIRKRKDRLAATVPLFRTNLGSMRPSGTIHLLAKISAGRLRSHPVLLRVLSSSASAGSHLSSGGGRRGGVLMVISAG